MLNRQGILCGVFGIFFVFSVASIALGQNVDVLKAELKGVERRLDAKIDGAKNELDAKIDGAKNELNVRIDGMKNELNAKIDGVKNELTTDIKGVKNELNASINGVKSELTIIKWIISGIGAVFLVFLGFLVHLLNFYVKKVLPNMFQRESRGNGDIGTGQLQEEIEGTDRFADNTQPD